MEILNDRGISSLVAGRDFEHGYDAGVWAEALGVDQPRGSVAFFHRYFSEIDRFLSRRVGADDVLRTINAKRVKAARELVPDAGFADDRTWQQVHLVWQRSVLPTSGVAERLTASRRETVVLERVAGTTNWYVCRRAEDLPLIAARLSPGSWVGFYFEDRFRRMAFNDDAEVEILRVITDTQEAVVGVVTPGEVVLDAHVLTDSLELSEVYVELVGHDIYLGPYPDPATDGVHAITLVLPDADGVVRKHPY